MDKAEANLHCNSLLQNRTRRFANNISVGTSMFSEEFLGSRQNFEISVIISLLFVDFCKVRGHFHSTDGIFVTIDI
jgi:hypothetical protein